MSVKIRLKRMGMKKKPFYRVVVADIRSPRDGRFIEEIGYYDPMTNSVTETEGPEAVILELHVAEDDMGKVIGKQGRIAKAIRAVVKAATLKNSKPVFVEIQ